MTLTDHITAITTAAELIPQQLADREQHSPEWRHLLQCIRNMGTETAKASALGGFSAVFEAVLDLESAMHLEDVVPDSTEEAEVLRLIWSAAFDLGVL